MVLAHIEKLAGEMGAAEPQVLAHQLALLIDGAIVAAMVSRDPGRRRHRRPCRGQSVRAFEGRTRRHAALVVSVASIGSPSSIGSDGSRDHSFQEPKYIRTSFTPAFFSARNVFEARAPLKQ